MPLLASVIPRQARPAHPCDPRRYLPIGVGLISLRYGLPQAGRCAAAERHHQPVALTLHAVPAALTLIAVAVPIASRLPDASPAGPSQNRSSLFGLVFRPGLPRFGSRHRRWRGNQRSGFHRPGSCLDDDDGAGFGGSDRGALRRPPCVDDTQRGPGAIRVTLRLYLPLASLAGADFVMAYRLASWGCWVPNLIIAEWWSQSPQAGERPPPDPVPSLG